MWSNRWFISSFLNCISARMIEINAGIFQWNWALIKSLFNTKLRAFFLLYVMPYIYCIYVLFYFGGICVVIPHMWMIQIIATFDSDFQFLLFFNDWSVINFLRGPCLWMSFLSMGDNLYTKFSRSRNGKDNRNLL